MQRVKTVNSCNYLGASFIKKKVQVTRKLNRDTIQTITRYTIEFSNIEKKRQEKRQYGTVVENIGTYGRGGPGNDKTEPH